MKKILVYINTLRIKLILYMLKRLFSTAIKYPITITDNSWNKMSSIIKKQNAPGFLFSASSGGCNGFNYKLKLLDQAKFDKINDDNKKFKTTIIEKDNVKVLIDPMAEMILMGTIIDSGVTVVLYLTDCGVQSLPLLISRVMFPL